MHAKDNCSSNFSEGSPHASVDEPIKRRPGAPKGNKNALKHGLRTRESDEFRAAVRAHIRETRAAIKFAKAVCKARRELERRHRSLTPSSCCPSS